MGLICLPVIIILYWQKNRTLDIQISKGQNNG